MAIEIIKDYSKAEAVNEYIEGLKGVQVDDVFAETFTPKRTEDGSPRGVASLTQKIQAAARANGFTARVQETVDDGTDVRLIFRAFPAQKSPERKDSAAE